MSSKPPRRLSRGRGSPDSETLYPEHIDSGAARVVTMCFGFCSALCLVLFYLVLSLAIIPEMGEGDWVDVKCRATEAAVASEPSTVCAYGQTGAGRGNVNCDVETDPERPTPGGLWEERCHDTNGRHETTGTCIRHVWANVLLEWEPPTDDHHKVLKKVDHAVEGMHETVERVMHKKAKEARTQKYLSVCYPYRCGGTDAMVEVRRQEAEELALGFVDKLRNASGINPLAAGATFDGFPDGAKVGGADVADNPTAADAAAAAAAATAAAAGAGATGGSGSGGSDSAEKERMEMDIKKDDLERMGKEKKEKESKGMKESKGVKDAEGGSSMPEKLISMSPGKTVDDKDSVRRQQQQQQLKKPAAVGAGAGAGAAGEVGTSSQPVKDGQAFVDSQGLGDLSGWMHRPCAYSRTFYSTVPGISPLRRGANAAVYFKKPTGYTDLPGGVTAWSVLVLIVVGICAVGQLCCLRSQCKAYGIGGPKKAIRGGHIL